MNKILSELKEAFVNQQPDKTLAICTNIAEVFDDAIAASEFLRQTPIDILFVDIQMPDISGIDLGRSLPEKPIIIFQPLIKILLLRDLS